MGIGGVVPSRSVTSPTAVAPFSTLTPGKAIPVKGVITCHTKSVIHLITCPCGNIICWEDQSGIKKPRCRNLNYPVAAHFLEEKHPISSIWCIEKVSFPIKGGNLDNLLSKVENFFSHYLKTFAPYDLNVDFELKCSYNPMSSLQGDWLLLVSTFTW